MGSNRRPELDMATYLRSRQTCPRCGHHPGKLTEVRYEAPPDLNVVQCYDCGWVGTVNEMKPQQEKKMTQQGQLQVDAVIKKYIENRDLIEAKTKALDAELADIKATQKKIEAWLSAKMDQLGSTSIKKTGIGTCFFKTRTSATLADRIEFTNWVLEDWAGRAHFLDVRVSKTAVDKLVDDGDVPPPGTNYTTTRVVQVNRG